MKDYKQLYQADISQNIIDEIKSDLAAERVEGGWENQFWAIKCVCAYDESDYDPAFVRESVENVMRCGLSYDVDEACYLESIRMLSIAYMRMEKYVNAINCLMTTIDYIPEAPNWVFHDLCYAQNRTQDIERNLRKPKRYLQDLMHLDDTRDDRKIINIFKDFLACGIVFLSDHPESDVGLSEIKQAYDTCRLNEPELWDAFEKATGGSFDEPILSKIRSIKEAGMGVNEGIGAAPMIISLFSDTGGDHDDNKDFKEDDLLQKLKLAEEEIQQKQAALDAAGDEVVRFAQANDNLRKTIEKHELDLDSFRKQIAEKEKLIEDIQKTIEKEQQDSKDYERLVSEHIEQTKVLDETTSRLKEVESTLREAKNRASERNAIIAEEKAKNKALQDELEKLKKESKQTLTGNVAADVRGRFASYMHLTTVYLAEWLNRKLRRIANDWWERCVMRQLSQKQVEQAQSDHYDSLMDFDLAALLRILSCNWNRLSNETFMPPSSRACVDKMFPVRNRWAHAGANLPMKGDLIADLETISEFWSFLDRDMKTRRQVDQFAIEIGKMKELT